MLLAIIGPIWVPNPILYHWTTAPFHIVPCSRLNSKSHSRNLTDTIPNSNKDRDVNKAKNVKAEAKAKDMQGRVQGHGPKAKAKA